MFNISERTKKFLEKYLPQALETDDINEALDLIEEFMLFYGFDAEHNHDLTDIGDEAQKAYDDLYYSNEE